jgi:hypothetical protein
MTFGGPFGKNFKKAKGGKIMMKINDPNSDLESHQRYEEEMERQIERVWKYKELWDAFDDMEEDDIRSKKE